MRLKEVMNERAVGVAFDRDRHTLIHISRLTQKARMIRFTITFVLAIIFGLAAGWLFDGWWSVSAALLACAILFMYTYLSPYMRTHYDSWQYPESYDMFDDETIRDRFFTHTEEFTHIEEK